MTMSKGQYRDLFGELKALGYTRERGHNSHWKIYSPAGRLVGVAPHTPGDRRGVQNLRHDLRRRGVPV